MEAVYNAIWEAPSLSTLPGKIEEGLCPVLITNTNSALRAGLAVALHKKTGRPVFVVCPDDSMAQSFAADIFALSGKTPEQLKGRDFVLRDTESYSRQEEQRRLQTLDRLLHASDEICVSTVQGVLLRTLPMEILQSVAFTLRTGEGNGPEETEKRLLSCGYSRTELVEGPGQFSRRGGILDIFSPGTDRPVRVEYWGDEIDTMGFFDTDTQRRTENAEEVRILPACEALSTGENLPETVKSLKAYASRLRRRNNGEESSRRLSLDVERLQSVSRLPWADRYLPVLYDAFATAIDYIPSNALILIDSPRRCEERANELSEQLRQDCHMLEEGAVPVFSSSDYMLDYRTFTEVVKSHPVVLADAFAAGRYLPEPASHLSADVRQLPSYGGSLETAISDVRRYLDISYRAIVLASDRRRAEVLTEALQREGLQPLQGFEKELPPPGRCAVQLGGLSAGLELPELSLAILTDTQILGTALRSRKKKKALADREKLGSCADLSVGDLVVHEQYGIGRFAGIFKIPVDNIVKDYIKICYAGTDSLYVPATQLDLVSKYIGAGDNHTVKLSKMGGAEWHHATSRARAATKELAEQLTRLYAERQRTPGFAFSPDSPWQTEFEEAFGYAETDDQLRCIQEIKEDMQSSAPMDRLLCGDVGYGKTEVALRAAMKCILDGKQCALLVPTTVLARQHFQTATRRFFGYPVEIAMLSRYNTPAQRKAILKKLEAGSIDLLIGTHSLLQKSVQFKDLGLLIVDEEQRFGVSHKEKLKEMSKGVDVLTLSATPIPRTLNMALSGLRGMSAIEEPPHDRQPVQTFVIEHDWTVICDAIRRELMRGGQVYYLHNRVDNIEHVALRLQKMLDGAAVAAAHGKMSEEQLGRVMDDVVDGKVQVLVCTTIIETGIDIPNVNTLIVEDADRLGLAQLHQLRGRVGRSSRRATAYLTYRKDKVLTEIAEKRLMAILEFAEFNAGFQIAMRDLEIRGAGNLLGAEQSGHLMDVGYDLYLKLLEEAVLEEKGEQKKTRTECSADLSVTANIPESYISSSEQRMDVYRRIALIRSQEDADDVIDELIDRFGDPPPNVTTLVSVALLRGEASLAGISDITQKSGTLYFTVTDFTMERVSAVYARPEFHGRVRVEAGKTPRLGMRLKPGMKPIEEARAFVAAWASTAPPPEADEIKEEN